MARVVGIDHLVLSVGDFARSKDFYRKVLGLSASSSSTSIRTWRAGATVRRCSGSPPPTPRAGSTSTARATSAFAAMGRASSRKDVDALGAFLVEHGMTVVARPASTTSPRITRSIHDPTA